eukprot:1340030-Lingulodinium_polyedra.AAC.1
MVAFPFSFQRPWTAPRRAGNALRPQPRALNNATNTAGLRGACTTKPGRQRWPIGCPPSANCSATAEKNGAHSPRL